MPAPKSTGSNSSTSGVKTRTRRPSGGPTVLPVQNPMDLWYLCQKAGFAEMHPLTNAKGEPMYQRTVTNWIRMDYNFAKGVWPYAGEVGFDMLDEGGPTAIMSKKALKKEGFERPSRMPLSAYDAIRNREAVGRISLAEDPWFMGLRETLDSKQTLEEQLTASDFKRIHQIVQGRGEELDRRGLIRMPGSLRIPDVIRVKDFMLHKGAARFKPDNIAYLIEMKFGDALTKEQATDYLTIVADDRNKFRLLETKVCRINRDERNREWLKKARQTEPVFGTIEGKITPPPTRLKEAVPEYQLLINEILREQQEVRRLLDPLRYPQPTLREFLHSSPLERPQINPNTSVVKAWDPKLDAERERQRERTRQGLELTLAAPFAGAAAGTVVAGTTLLSGGAALGEGATVIATQGGKIIRFPGGRIAVSIAANAAIFEAAAQTPSTGKQGEPNEPPQHFIFYYLAD